MRQALLISIWQLSAILLIASFRLDGGRHTCSGFSRNIWLCSISGSGRATHRVVYKPILLCALIHCPVGRWTFCPSECSGLSLLSLRLSLYFGALSFFSILMSPSVPAAEKHPHSMTLLILGWYSADDEQGPCFLQTLVLELRFTRTENLVSHSLRVL